MGRRSTQAARDSNEPTGSIRLLAARAPQSALLSVDLGQRRKHLKWQLFGRRPPTRSLARSLARTRNVYPNHKRVRVCLHGRLCVCVSRARARPSPTQTGLCGRVAHDVYVYVAECAGSGGSITVRPRAREQTKFNFGPRRAAPSKIRLQFGVGGRVSVCVARPLRAPLFAPDRTRLCISAAAALAAAAAATASGAAAGSARRTPN